MFVVENDGLRFLPATGLVWMAMITAFRRRAAMSGSLTRASRCQNAFRLQCRIYNNDGLRHASAGLVSMSYLAFKHLHVTCAALSGMLFLVRGAWMLQGSSMLQQRWVKIVPHVIDTLLLGSALVMVFWSAQYPFVQSWLTAKVLALIVYIVLGTIALKRGRTRPVQLAAFLGALAVFAYIVKVALTRQPW